ncbi:MAG: hypothetical protein KDA44_21920 [Planctomycetales bacterium]|nr:hypothetical protein [Planctomycetales bacterium]
MIDSDRNGPLIRISLRQLMCVVTCLGVFLGLQNTRPLLIACLMPGLLGPLIAFANIPTRGALLLGVFSAYFLAGLIMLVAVPVIGFVYVATGGLPVNPLHAAATIAAVVGGLIGGLLGARVEQIGLVHSDRQRKIAKTHVSDLSAHCDGNTDASKSCDFNLAATVQRSR